MNKNKFYTLGDFDFFLPEELIAQYPAEPRGMSRLLIVNRKNGQLIHDSFYNISHYLHKDDILIFNNAKVIPARIFCRRSTGSKVELVLTKHDTINNTWIAICNRLKRLKAGEILYPIGNENINIIITEKLEDEIIIKTNPDLSNDILAKIGQLPLPPYIQRAPEPMDYERYQTVYAKEEGAVAAPTAGLHFTEEILKQLQDMGVTISFLTLYVSWGTFHPVRHEDILQHTMHYEEYYLPPETVDAIYNAKSKGGRVIAVGTTSLRVLESVYKERGYTAGYGETNLFIYPPYKIKSVDALITNFHTPKSTLLMLVSAFAGYEYIMNAYNEAVKHHYRFFSYGDAMLII